MMSRFYLLFSLPFLILGIALLSCQQEVYEGEPVDPEVTSFVEKAKQFFEFKVAGEPIFAITRSDAPPVSLFPGTVIPRWEKPYIYDTDKHRFLYARLEQDIFRYHTRQTDPEDGRSYRTKVYQAAVFARALDDPDRWWMGIASFIPDRKTEHAYRGKVLDRFLDEPAHGGFTGKVLFSRIADMGIYAILVFKDGVPVRKIHSDYYDSEERFRADIRQQLEGMELLTMRANPTRAIGS